MKDNAYMQQAMQRRFQANQEQDPNLTLARGLEALAMQPKEIQDEYAPAMIRAKMLAAKQAQMQQAQMAQQQPSPQLPQAPQQGGQNGQY